MENNGFVWLPSLGQDAENITHLGVRTYSWTPKGVK